MMMIVYGTAAISCSMKHRSSSSGWFGDEVWHFIEDYSQAELLYISFPRYLSQSSA
jgi:hypothetical protein